MEIQYHKISVWTLCTGNDYMCLCKYKQNTEYYTRNSVMWLDGQVVGIEKQELCTIFWRGSLFESGHLKDWGWDEKIYKNGFKSKKLTDFTGPRLCPLAASVLCSVKSLGSLPGN